MTQRLHRAPTTHHEAGLHEAGLEEDFTQLRAKLDQLGYDKRLAGPVWGTWAISVLALIGGLGLASVPSAPLWLRVVGFVGCILGTTVNAKVGHTASRNALGPHRLANRVMFHVAYPFFMGLSARYWYKSHVSMHHPSPNVAGVDDDIDLRPFVTHDGQYGPEGRTFWHRIQGLVLLLILPINGFNMQRQGFLSLGRHLVNPEQRGAWKWVDLGCLIMHYACWVALPVFLVGPKAALTVCLLRIIVMGTALFAILAPGHFPAEAKVISIDVATRFTFAER